MARVEGKCIGDCSRCELLAEEKVDMIPCVLDQIFNRVQRYEREISEIKTRLSEMSQDKSSIQLAEISETAPMRPLTDLSEDD